MRHMLKQTLQTGIGTKIFLQTSSPKIRPMLDKAVDLMTNTKDPSHGIEHIKNLLKDTNRFFKATGNQFNIDKEILLLSIYWHDVWKSQTKPTLGNYLFQQLYDGWGSMFMFKKYARLIDLSPEVIRPVSYAIRKHAAFQSRPARTLEAQLLWDVDTMDVWNSQRAQAAFKDLRGTNISIFDSFMLYMKKVGFRLNFEWTRNEVEKMKPLFFEEMSKFRDSLMSGNKRPERWFAQPKAISSHPHHPRSIRSARDLDDKS